MRMDDFVELLALSVVSVIVVLAGTFVRPTHARCPPGTHHYGIRLSGSFSCTRDLIGGEDDPAGGIDTAIEPPGEIAGRIYCRPGMLPTWINERTMRCSRGHYQ